MLRRIVKKHIYNELRVVLVEEEVVMKRSERVDQTYTRSGNKKKSMEIEDKIMINIIII